MDKSVTFHGFLHQLGVETSSDLRCMWPSGQAMVEEFEQEVGRLDGRCFRSGVGVHPGFQA